MKKILLTIFSIIFIMTFITGCSVETAASHDARTESEAESIRDLQESVSETQTSESQGSETVTVESQNTSQVNNSAQTTTAAASAVVETPSNLTVYLSIDCSGVIGKENLSTSATIGDGKWLTSKSIIVPTGSTVFDVLKYAQAAGYLLSFTEDNSITSGYIISINSLYQKECGKWSGWMYKVNGTSPGIGAGAYTVKDGDSILWFFTTSS